MSTIAQTPQDHVPATVDTRPAYAPKARRRRWQLNAMPSALAAVALAAAVGLGAWGLDLNGQLRQRDAALGAIASADAVHLISGQAGSALLLEVGDTATFVAEDLAEPPADRIYQFWLIDAQGNALPAGTLDETDGVALVDLDRGIEEATSFAITLEESPVQAPTSTRILGGELET